MINDAAELWLNRLSRPRAVLDEQGPVHNLSLSLHLAGAIEAVKLYYKLTGTVMANEECYCPGWIKPKSCEDLKRKRYLLSTLSEKNYGLMGRLPDFMNTVLASVEANSAYLKKSGSAEFSNRIQRYCARVRREKLFVTHAAVNMGVFPNGIATRYPPRIIKNCSDGVIISGVKKMSTMSPLADEILVFNMPNRSGGNIEEQIVFSVPVSSEGLKIICRRAVSTRNSCQFDYPLSSRFDEVDCIVLLDDVFIHEDNVFVLCDSDLSNNFYSETGALAFAAFHGLIRVIIKFEFLISVLKKIVEELVPATRAAAWNEKIGASVARYRALEALLDVSISNSSPDYSGVFRPALTFLTASRLLAAEAIATISSDLRTIVSGPSLGVPGWASLKEFAKIDDETVRRLKLLNVGWDLTGTAFASRQLAYEFEHAGGVTRLATACFEENNFTRGDKLVELLIKSL